MLTASDIQRGVSVATRLGGVLVLAYMGWCTILWTQTVAHCPAPPTVVSGKAVGGAADGGDFPQGLQITVSCDREHVVEFREPVASYHMQCSQGEWKCSGVEVS
jgi:hypothetical protein